MCHIVAASHSEDAIGVTKLITKKKCLLDAVDVNVIIIINNYFCFIN